MSDKPFKSRLDHGLHSLRRNFWHLRQGGVAQLREHLSRQASSTLPGTTSRALSFHDTGFPAWPLPDPLSWPERRAIRAGIIADQFTLDALAYEWDQIELQPDSWQSQINQNPIDILFVESAWRANHDAWAFQLTGPSSPSQPLKELVSYCKESGIPTVFWNKEDPVHFDDFVATAALFDAIYTTDSGMIPRYQEQYPDKVVGLMSFAAQPAIHNPIRFPGKAGERSGAVAFAGTYYRDRFPARREQMGIVLAGALAAEPKIAGTLDIFSRFSEVDDKYRFPAPYDNNVIGELSYSQMLAAYRKYKVFLNVNSVTDSDSMCPRRAFEILACGASLISTPSPAITRFLEDFVYQTDQVDQVSDAVRSLTNSAEMRDRIGHLAQRSIWEQHTYGARIDTILTDIGLEHHMRKPKSVSALLSTNRPHLLLTALRQMDAQLNVNVEVCVLTHGFSPDQETLDAVNSLTIPVTWVEADSSTPLGECYNILASVAQGDVLTKIDDDDLYGPHYLEDQLAALRYSGADIVGKAAHYLYLENSNQTVLRFEDNEFKFHPFVSGPTIMGVRQVWLDTPFLPVSKGEDSAFLKAVRDSGGRIFSSDRFGFIQNRTSSGNHTWNIDDQQVLASSRVIAYGRLLEHVLI